jgi:hypothetical protein
MSFAEQSARVRFRQQYPALRAVGRPTDPNPPSNDGKPAASPRKGALEPGIVAASLRLACTTIGRIALQLDSAVPVILLSGVSWVVSEFLKGCALYAHTMYPMPQLFDDGVVPGDRLATPLNDPEPAPAAGRPRLVVVSTGSAAEITRQHVGTALADDRALRAIDPAHGEVDVVAKRRRK